jgi:hypothetical protein
MTTAFKTLTDELVSLLTQAPQITGSRVYAGRVRPLPTEHAHDLTVNIESVAGQAWAVGGGPTLWTGTWSVEIRARGDSATHALDALDPVLEAVYARLVVATPPAGVEGWALDIRPQIGIEEADTPIASCMLMLELKFRTAANSLNLYS